MKGSDMEPQMSDGLAAIFVIFAFIFLAFFALVTLVVTVITALVYCKVFSKAGFNWALGLLMLAPVANIVVLFYLAFVDWPIHRELRQLRQQFGTMPA
ncbi:MAG: hypothetical protein EHM35_10950 [Planctomycetaceae bacterium]|nr:MAG: hypothetical protein EHM35_10950 [Planctomycetaceae bacterium]